MKTSTQASFLFRGAVVVQIDEPQVYIGSK